MKKLTETLSTSFKKYLLNKFIGIFLIAGVSISVVSCNGSDSINTVNQTDTADLIITDVNTVDGTVEEIDEVAVVIEVTDEVAVADDSLDANEKTHLMFMREEEKMARDVYLKLGMMYPDSRIFGNIDDSEQIHTNAVKDMIEKYGLEDPNTNDNIGEYTGEEYGWYFTNKYNDLIERGSISKFEALYVGAYIEELDMIDIEQCPAVIVEVENGINNVSECGKTYTDNDDIVQLYTFLLKGSNNHLASYVKNIEKQIGTGNYQAQVFTQDQVNELLGR